MTKKALNQNGKYVQDLINTVEPNFVFGNVPINRFEIIKSNKNNKELDKRQLLLELKDQINSIENCNLKNNSKNLVLGDGNINSPIMLIGEAPGNQEDIEGKPFVGKSGKLLDKILEFININREDVVTICLGFPALNKKRIGLKKIPPPIPTTPDTNPIDAPINNDNIFGIFL